VEDRRIEEASVEVKGQLHSCLWSHSKSGRLRPFETIVYYV